MFAAHHERAQKSPGAVSVKCYSCNLAFKTWPYRAKAKRIFCSRKCSYKYTCPILAKAGNEACRGRVMSKEERVRRSLTVPKGERSGTWKGDKVKYRALHDWVASRLGKPHDCTMCGNTELRHRQYHWANVSGQYMRDTEDWMRLCATCHKRYDMEMKLLGITEMAY